MMSMPKQSTGVVVIGGGVAGAAISLELCRRGYCVTVLCRAADEGSSFTNQKWHHSGLLYPSKVTAEAACREFRKESPLSGFVYATPARSRFLALNPETIAEREQMWLDWGVPNWGLDWRRLEGDECRSGGLVGKTLAKGGFEVPDRVVDFGQLIGAMRQEVEASGGRVATNVTVSRILFGTDGVNAVEYTATGEACRLPCSRCIVAAGAWTPGLLNASEIASPDLILRKCIVLEYDEELVPGLTTCLDVCSYDGMRRDVTLVPFRGRTLAAGTGFTVVSSMENFDPEPLQIERLSAELVQCFPGLHKWRPRIVTCTKTEQRSEGRANVRPRVYGREFHGVGGLVVAIPGKASFMFDVAAQAVRQFEQL